MLQSLDDIKQLTVLLLCLCMLRHNSFDAVCLKYIQWSAMVLLPKHMFTTLLAVCDLVANVFAGKAMSHVLTVFCSIVQATQGTVVLGQTLEIDIDPMTVSTASQ